MFTHFPLDPNWDVCRMTKINRARCKRRPLKSDDGISPATSFGDLITADDKIFNLDESRKITETPFSPGKGAQRQRQDAGEGWKRVRHSKTARVDANQPAPRDKLQQDGWSVKVEHTLAGFHRANGWFSWQA